MIDQNTTTTPKTLRLLRLPEVMSRVALSKSAIYAQISAGTFPKQRRVGTRGARWLEASIDGWIIGQDAA